MLQVLVEEQMEIGNAVFKDVLCILGPSRGRYADEFLRRGHWVVIADVKDPEQAVQVRPDGYSARANNRNASR